MRSGVGTSRPDAAAPGADLYRGSPRLEPVLPLLHALPRPASEAVLAAMAVGDGLLRGRYSRARQWAARTGAGAAGSHLLAVRLLANHGRFCGDEARISGDDGGALRESVTIEGRDRLSTIQSGALLLGFHLGPPRMWLAMRALGVRVRMAGQFDRVSADPRWQPMFASADAIPLPDGDAAGRLKALYRIRTLLTQNEILYLTADGPHGQEAFRLDLPGGPLIVRKGWFALRRQLEVTTFPVLSHADGRRRVIEIGPPLPPALHDPIADAEACRDVLTPLVSDYVRRFPAQCRYLAFPPWE